MRERPQETHRIVAHCRTVGLQPRGQSTDLERGINLTARKDAARLLADALGPSGGAQAEFEATARGRSSRRDSWCDADIAAISPASPAGNRSCAS